MGVSNVRVIAATFHDETTAQRVLRRLRRAYELRRTDAELAPLGVAGSDYQEPVVLAGHFYDERVPIVRDLIERSGGRVVVDVDEAATKTRLTPVPRTEDERSQRICAGGASRGGDRLAN